MTLTAHADAVIYALGFLMREIMNGVKESIHVLVWGVRVVRDVGVCSMEMALRRAEEYNVDVTCCSCRSA